MLRLAIRDDFVRNQTKEETWDQNAIRKLSWSKAASTREDSRKRVQVQTPLTTLLAARSIVDSSIADLQPHKGARADNKARQ